MQGGLNPTPATAWCPRVTHSPPNRVSVTRQRSQSLSLSPGENGGAGRRTGPACRGDATIQSSGAGRGAGPPCWGDATIRSSGAGKGAGPPCWGDATVRSSLCPGSHTCLPRPLRHISSPQTRLLELGGDRGRGIWAQPAQSSWPGVSQVRPGGREGLEGQCGPFGAGRWSAGWRRLKQQTLTLPQPGGWSLRPCCGQGQLLLRLLSLACRRRCHPSASMSSCGLT